jgi:hypothetical protein
MTKKPSIGSMVDLLRDIIEGGSAEQEQEARLFRELMALALVGQSPEQMAAFRERVAKHLRSREQESAGRLRLNAELMASLDKSHRVVWH